MTRGNRKTTRSLWTYKTTTATATSTIPTTEKKNVWQNTITKTYNQRPWIIIKYQTRKIRRLCVCVRLYNYKCAYFERHTHTHTNSRRKMSENEKKHHIIYWEFLIVQTTLCVRPGVRGCVIIIYSSCYFIIYGNMLVIKPQHLIVMTRTSQQQQQPPPTTTSTICKNKWNLFKTLLYRILT